MFAKVAAVGDLQRAVDLLSTEGEKWLSGGIGQLETLKFCTDQQCGVVKWILYIY